MISFSPETHEYRHGGEIIPSVTQVVGAVLGTPDYATEWHMARGSAAHALYELLAQGEDLSDYNYDPRLQGYVDGWQAWSKAVGATDMRPELRIFHRAMRYAGTCDLLCLVRTVKGLLLVDFKASASARDRIQMGGYSLALEDMGQSVIEAHIVEIKEDGKWRIAYKWRGAELRMAQNDFRAVHRVYVLRNRK